MASNLARGSATRKACSNTRLVLNMHVTVVLETITVTKILSIAETFCILNDP